jgi:sugar phosphate isomerase/epimerase
MLKNITITGFADEIATALPDQVKLLKELGIDYLEFRSAYGKNIGNYTLEEAEAVCRYLKEEGIKVSAIGSPIGKIKITEDFGAHFEDYKRIVEMAKLFDTPNIRIFSFYIPQGEAPDQYREEVFERIERLIEYAKASGILLLHENEKDIYGDVASRVLELLQRFYGDNFKGIFDFANFVQCKQDTLKAYEMLEPFIAYIHIKDADFLTGEVRPAGKGDGHVAEILGRLDKKKYSGFLSLEPHLAEFDGLRDLEKNPLKRAMTGREEAFALAYASLKAILDRDDLI